MGTVLWIFLKQTLFCGREEHSKVNSKFCIVKAIYTAGSAHLVFDIEKDIVCCVYAKNAL